MALSIHAPTRGATGLCRFHARIFTLSIHAPTRGATVINILFSDIINFQSTLLQEERQFRCNSLASVLTFNPRSYKRSDGKPGQNQQRKCSFQSTLLQEERRHFYGMSEQNKLSIHAPTRGATHDGRNKGKKNRSFNPRSYKRSDGSNCGAFLL